jgi:transposase
VNKQIAQNIAHLSPGTLFIGIDVGSKRHQVSVMTEKAAIISRFGIANSREGFQFLVTKALNCRDKLGCQALIFGSEPAGHYWRPLAYYLESYRYPFKLVNSFSVKRYREGMDLARNKNDRSDADTIADMLRSGRFLHTVLSYGVHAELRRSYRHYCRLRSELTQKRNVLIAAVDSLFPEFRKAFKDILGKTAVAVLRTCPSPALIREISLEEWQSLVRRYYQGRCCKGMKKVQLVHQLAQESIGIPVEQQSLLREISFLLEGLAGVQSQIEILEADIRRYLHQIEGHELLLPIPGIGIISTAGILAEIGDMQRFSRIKQPVKLAGINPSEKQSGDFRGKSVMTKKVNTLLRTALYSAALGLISHNRAFGEYYHSLRKRQIRPLSGMQAIGAVMNKLLRVVYAILKKASPYNEEMIYPTEQKEVLQQA